MKPESENQNRISKYSILPSSLSSESKEDINELITIALTDDNTCYEPLAISTSSSSTISNTINVPS